MNCIGCPHISSKECGKMVFISPSSSGGRYEKISDKRCKVTSEKKKRK
nr:MAG TPA: hypothetical protein [Caudoviricetes sp.]